MATLKPELRKILDQYGIDPRDKSQIWDCHGTLVLYHKAYEIIAAKENIRFDPPMVIEANSEKKVATICVVGHMGERTEWSIGEASELNYRTSQKQAAYPWAMAEKRAKDRVIAKLVGLAQYVYSEDEADEFKDDRQPVETAPKPAAKKMAASEWVEMAKDQVAKCVSYEQVQAWLHKNIPALTRLQETDATLHADLEAYIDSKSKSVNTVLAG